MFPYKTPGIKLLQSPVVTADHITVLAVGCSAVPLELSGSWGLISTVPMAGAVLVLPAGGRLSSPVWLLQPGDRHPKDRALQTGVKATWLARNFFIFLVEERQNRKINSGM